MTLLAKSDMGRIHGLTDGKLVLELLAHVAPKSFQTTVADTIALPDYDEWASYTAAVAKVNAKASPRVRLVCVEFKVAPKAIDDAAEAIVKGLRAHQSRDIYGICFRLQDQNGGQRSRS